MKRSEINRWLQESREFMESLNWQLPPFADWELQEWQEIMESPDLQAEYQEIIQKGLGWDLSDFGSGDFYQTGLVLFTLRNGDLGTPRDYAEKIMVQRENQVTPWHYHWTKAEDIINRGGGRLIIELYHPDRSETIKPKDPWVPGKFDTQKPITYSHDGMTSTVSPGTAVSLRPGESITLPPCVYHKFYAQEGHGWVMIGEVSKVNDDTSDNRFYTEMPRYVAPEEDELPKYVLCHEYKNVMKYQRVT
jgi:D-lyxose ketol-isomerase